MTTASYDDLVAAATVGLSRRPLHVTGLDGAAAGHAGVLDSGDQAAALLDAAALMVAARRAGARAVAGVACPEPAAEDTAAELPARAADLLEQARLADPALLASLLDAAASLGYRAPAPLLPALLDAAVKDHALRPLVAAVLGARGRWLAGYRSDWQPLADAAVPGTSGPDAAGPDAAGPGAGRPDTAGPDTAGPGADRPDTAGPDTAGPGADRPDTAGPDTAGPGASGPDTAGPDTAGPGAAADDPAIWETGRRPERRGYLAALRARDPAAARDLLAAGWPAETGDDRADLLGVLARGLSAADEEFLETVLDDRKAPVRAAARRLLTQLPGSAFTRRAAQRATALLRLEQHGRRPRLVATRPDRADAAAVRDGLNARPPTPAIGPGSWLLIQMISAAPLAGWGTSLGLDPRQLASLPVAGDLRADVHAGWRLAAIGQASSPWAEALLAVPEPGQAIQRPPDAWPRDFQLAALLAPPARATRAAALLATAAAMPDALTEVRNCAGPWPHPLDEAVIAALRRTVTSAARLGTAVTRAGWPEQLAAAAGRGLPAAGPTDYAAVLARLAHIDKCPPHWSSALRRAAAAVAVRRAFLEEIR
jgi:Family of unknown function (DUF5691)